MQKPQVTITLGRSGQRVVKGPRTASNGALAGSQPLSGSKRYVGERITSDADSSILSVNKRLRGDVTTRNSGRRGVNEARVGRNDLRFKLMRKRTSRRVQHEIEQHEKIEIREKMSKTIHSPAGPERNLLRHIPPARRAVEVPPVDSSGRSYYARTLNGLIPGSSDRVLKPSRGFSPPRNIDELRQVPSRPLDASRGGRNFGSHLLGPSRREGPPPITMRATIDAGKPIQLPPASSGMPRSPYLGEQPHTVSGLLHSLGLGKYAIQFQAEEVDMAALKQMGDRDLKELGIPMGPRKKILLAILPCSKRQTIVTTA